MSSPKDKSVGMELYEGVTARTINRNMEVDARDPLRDFFMQFDQVEGTADEDSRDLFAVESVGHDVVELLAFWTADEEYAISIVKIQEIIKVPLITAVPRAPRSVLGIISLRGTIVPVIDLRVLLRVGSTEINNKSRVLVLQGEGDPMGILVDEVSSVVRFDRDAIQPLPRSMRREASELLQGVGRDGERMLIVIDLSAVFKTLEEGA